LCNALSLPEEMARRLERRSRVVEIGLVLFQLGHGFIQSSLTFDGEVVQIRRSTRDNAITSDVVISAPNRELLLQSGMKATVQILVDKRNTIL
jgi:hypothetical protein